MEVVFLTVDWGLNYKHYSKDVGMIPYLLEKKYGYTSVILGTKKVEGYIKPFDDYEVKTIIIDDLFHSDLLNVCRYIWKNGKCIDYLNLYHMNTRYNYILSKIYKVVNPKGFVYLKLDMGYRGVKLAQNDTWLKHWSKRKMLRSADLITNENSEVCGMLEKIYDVPIKYLPNGWYGNIVQNRGERDIDHLYVGRIGVKEKGVDVLLEAFRMLSKNINLHLVGKIEPGYQSYLDGYIAMDPELAGRIHFWGEIRDRRKLSEIYDRAKCVIVPSRWESFGIVMVEAQAHGCYIFASDQVSSAHDVIINSKMGCLFASEDPVDLAKKINDLDYLTIDRDGIYENSLKFQWEVIIEQLDLMLSSGV